MRESQLRASWKLIPSPKKRDEAEEVSSSEHCHVWLQWLELLLPFYNHEWRQLRAVTAQRWMSRQTQKPRFLTIRAYMEIFTLGPHFMRDNRVVNFWNQLASLFSVTQRYKSPKLINRKPRIHVSYLPSHPPIYFSSTSWLSRSLLPLSFLNTSCTPCREGSLPKSSLSGSISFSPPFRVDQRLLSQICCSHSTLPCSSMSLRAIVVES